MKSVRLVALASAVAVSVLSGVSAANAADAKKGQQLFITYGCYGCHGYNGQGSTVTGSKLAPDPMPLEALTNYIRNSSTAMMPPYSEQSVSNADVADMHAWLSAQPKVDAKSISILKD